MSQSGQTRSFADVRAMSALPPEAVVERTSMDDRFVPSPDARWSTNELRDWSVDGRRRSEHISKDHFLGKMFDEQGSPPNVRQYSLEHGWIGSREKRR